MQRDLENNKTFVKKSIPYQYSKLSPGIGARPGPSTPNNQLRSGARNPVRISGVPPSPYDPKRSVDIRQTHHCFLMPTFPFPRVRGDGRRSKFSFYVFVIIFLSVNVLVACFRIPLRRNGQRRASWPVDIYFICLVAYII